MLVSLKQNMQQPQFYHVPLPYLDVGASTIYTCQDMVCTLIQVALSIQLHFIYNHPVLKLNILYSDLT